MKEINAFRINTSAWEEEDFYILTSLTEDEVKSVMEPMVSSERVNDFLYDNDEYIIEFKKRFPKDKIEMYNEFETLTF